MCVFPEGVDALKSSQNLQLEERTIVIMNQGELKSKRGPGVLRTLLSILILIVLGIALAFFALDCAADVLGISDVDEKYSVSVGNSDDLYDISATLQDKGVIDYSLVFYILGSISMSDTEAVVGDYVFDSKMTYFDIIADLKDGGRTVEQEIVTVVFYEGMTVAEIAEHLEDERVCDADAFLERLEQGEFGYEFEEMIPENELRFRSYEGYLFPDSYDFYVGENPESVIRKFLVNFQNRVFPDVYADISGAGYTLDEIVILASIIQEESSNTEQMGNVSSVFHNRLNDPGIFPKLQSDVTIFYVEDDIKPYQSLSRQDMYDAYNTYVTNGLPVGPICSPGLAAINAAVSPSDTPYFYFVTDVNGKFYYATTLNEHDYNVDVAESVVATDD